MSASSAAPTIRSAGTACARCAAANAVAHGRVVHDHGGQTGFVVANLAECSRSTPQRIVSRRRSGRARRALQAARGRARRSRPPALTGDRSHFSFVREAE
jgi:hypothetical protein